MKIYFAVTYQGANQYGNFYKMIYEEIEKLGYEHLDKNAISLSYDDYLKNMTKGREAQVSNYHSVIEYLKKADVCVLEASAHSLGLGFVVQKSLEMGKPTLVLYYKDNIPYFLQGIEDDKLMIKSYDESNYKKVIKNSLNVAREKRDKRFNFFLSPKLLTYLENVSQEHGVTKSKILRDLIVEHMRGNSKKIEE
jgi:hypothetical protein